MDQFDPYHSWLGIPPHHQPPDHYRLLGVQAFESDADVIANAANRQMGHVRTYQTGKHEALSQRLLNEIAAAKVCLLHPQKKAGYDEQLRSQQQSRRPGSKQPRIIQAKPLPEPNSPGVEAAPTIVTGAASAPLVTTSGSINTGRPGLSRSRPAKPVWKSPLAIAAACSTIPLLIIVVVVGVRMARIEQQQKVAEHEFETPTSEQTKPNEDGRGGGSADENPQDANDATRSSNDPTPPKTDTDPPKDAEATSPDNPDRPDDEPAPPKPKASPPDAAAVRAAALEIAELFELDKQKTGLAKNAAAKKLLEAAVEEEKNTPAHYALLCSSRDLAASVADVGTALGAIDQLDAVYAIDVWAMKLQVLEAASRNVPKVTLARFIRSITEMTQQAMADGRYEIASGIAGLAIASARRARNRDLIRQSEALVSRATRLQNEFQATIAPALAKLKTSPDDPAANLIAGKHYCLNRAEWRVGVKMLEKSDHEKIKAAAQFDLSRPTDHRKQVVVGDAWYEVANSDKTFEGFHARAHYWYESAFEDLGGLDKLKVEKRMQETAKFAALAPKPAERRVVDDKPASKSSLHGIKVVLRHTVTEKEAGVKSHLEFAPDGLTVAVAYPHVVKILDAKTGRQKIWMDDPDQPVITSLAFSSNGRTIAYGKSDGGLRLWDITTNMASLNIRIGTAPLKSMVFAPDGNMLACCVSRQHVDKIDVGVKKGRMRFPCPVGVDFGPMAYRPNKNQVAVGLSDGSLRLLDFTTAKVIGLVRRHTSAVLSVAFSHDGALLASGGADHSICFSNPDDGKIIAKLTGHKGAVLGLAFSPDSKILASVSADNTVKLWDVAGKKLWKTLEGHPSQPSGADTGSIAFSPDGRILASCGNYTLKIWAATRR